LGNLCHSLDDDADIVGGGTGLISTGSLFGHVLRFWDWRLCLLN
jgi:hypothetical protein